MLVKQKSFWALLVCTMFAIGFACFGNILHPPIKAIDNVERCVQKNDVKGMLKSFAPSDREMIQGLMGLAEGLTGENAQMSYLYPELESLKDSKINFLYTNPSSTDKDPEVVLFTLISKNGKCVSASTDRTILKNVDGKLYLSE